MFSAIYTTITNPINSSTPQNHNFSLHPAGRLRNQQGRQGSLRPALGLAGGGARPRFRERRVQGPRVYQRETREGHDIAQREAGGDESPPGHRLLHRRPRERAEQVRGARAHRHESGARQTEATARAVYSGPAV